MKGTAWLWMFRVFLGIRPESDKGSGGCWSRRSGEGREKESAMEMGGEMEVAFFCIFSYLFLRNLHIGTL